MIITYVPNRSRADGKPVIIEGVSVPFVSHSVPIYCHDDLQAGDPVTVDGRLASSADLSTFGKLLGLATLTVSNGASPAILISGRIESVEWHWDEGDVIYLNGTSLSSQVPTQGYVQQVGVADGSSSLIVTIGLPIKV